MAKYMDRDGNVFDEQDLWDCFLQGADDLGDDEFQAWLEDEGLVEVAE